MISPEDKSDVARSFGKKAAAAVSGVTNDARNKAIHAKLGSGGSKSPKYPGYRTMSGAARRNARMDSIFDRAKSEGRGLVGNSGTKGAGVNSPAMVKARRESKSDYTKRHGADLLKYETN